MLASLLVGDVARAVGIAVRDEDTFAVYVDHRRVFEQDHSRFGGEPVAEQEVAVTVHDMHCAALCSLAERVANGHRGGVIVVVAHPDLDEVAQDVECVDVVAQGRQEPLPPGQDVRASGVDVQIRYEQRWHRRCRRVL